jgi:hypothetical protein
VLADPWLTLWSKQSSAPGADLAPNATPIIDNVTRPPLLLAPSSDHPALVARTIAFVFLGGAEMASASATYVQVVCERRVVAGD